MFESHSLIQQIFLEIGSSTFLPLCQTILEGGLLPRMVGTPASFKLNGGDSIDADSHIYIIQDGSLHVNKDIPPTTRYGYNAIFMYQTDSYV